MASRAKHGWSALQSAFTAPKFSATAEDALIDHLSVSYRDFKREGQRKKAKK
jgi:hypothetical protein